MTENDRLKMQFVWAAYNAVTPADIQESVYSLPSGAWNKIADFIIDYCTERGIDKHAPEIAAFYQEAEENRAKERQEQKTKAAANLSAQIEHYQKNITAGVKLDDPGLVELTRTIEKTAAALGLSPEIKDRLGTWAAYIQDCTIYQPEKDFRPAIFAGLAFPDGTVSYIGARTGRGKTTAMVNIAREALTDVTPRKVVFITLEMSRKQILNKLILSTAYSLAAEGNDGEIFEKRDKPTDDLYRIIKDIGLAGAGSSEVWKYTKKALSIIESTYNNFLFLYDGRGANYNEIISAIHTYGEPGAVILLDYIQRMPDAPDSATDTYMRVKKISDGVVNAAVKTNSIIISGAQFKRATGKETIGKADTFDDSSYRESGDLEQDAHNALGIGWEADKKFRFLEILKTREDKGAGKKYNLYFNGAYSYMANRGERIKENKNPGQSGNDQRTKMTGEKII
jgi:hypothetical protein